MHKDAVCNTFAARLSCQELLLKKKKKSTASASTKRWCWLCHA